MPDHPGVPRRPRSSLLLVAAVACGWSLASPTGSTAIATATATGAGAAVTATVPAQPVVVPADPDVEGLEVAPAVVRMEIEDGGSAVAAVAIANGGDVPVRLGLAVERLEAASDGTPAGAGDGGLVLPSDELFLDPGEAATVELSIDGALAPGVVRLRAATSGTDAQRHVDALIEVARPGAEPPQVTTSVELTRDAAGIALSSDRPAVVTARVRVATAWSVLLDRTVGPLVVFPAALRTLTVELDPGWAPTPVRAEVAVAHGDTVVAATEASRLHLPGTAIVSLAAAVVLGGAGLIWLLVRRWRSSVPDRS